MDNVVWAFNVHVLGQDEDGPGLKGSETERIVRLLRDFWSRESYEERRKMSGLKLAEFPGRVPVILVSPDKLLFSRSGARYNIRKFLFEDRLPWTHAIIKLRAHMDVLPEEAVFLYTVNEGWAFNFPSGTSTMGSVYRSHQMPDGFLYVIVVKENTFGGSES